MARWRDIATLALRQINVVAHDEAPEAVMASGAKDALEVIYADLNSDWGGCTLTFGIEDDVPAAYVTWISRLLATRLAPVYERASPWPEMTAIMHIRAVNVPYVRDMDLDDDGTTDDDEIEAVDRSRYY